MDRPTYMRSAFLIAVLLLSSLAAANTLASNAYATFPGTNGKILFVSGEGVSAVNPDGTGLVQISKSSFLNPKWSPDGTKIVFDNNKDIFVFNLVTGVLANLTNGDEINSSHYPAWSGDGTKIVYDRDAQVYVMNADGTNRTLISSISPSTTYPSWSPDGKKIAFVNGGTVAIMNPDGTGTTNVPGTALEAFNLNWSPDSKKISFGSGGSAYAVNPDGTGLAKLVDNSNYMSWSPDGSKIVFASGTIFIANADGSGPVDTGVPGAYPDWGISSSVVLPPPSNSAPKVTGAVDRAPDSNGYYNHEIIITWSGTDSDGIASCDPEI